MTDNGDMKFTLEFLAGVAWIAGVVISKGFWCTFFALIFPFWSWYLVIEFILNKYVFMV